MMSARGLAIVEEDIAQVLAAPLPWERFAGTTVAVTGASGFIGAYFVRVLLALNKTQLAHSPLKVIAISRDDAKARERFADLLGNGSGSLELVTCDLSQPAGLSLTAQWIVHAASPASPKHYGSDPVGTLGPNMLGTWRLLELAQASGAQGMLYVSSSEVYGDTSGASQLDESSYGALDPVSPRSVYAEGKRAGEAICVAFMRQRGVPVFIVRPFHTYGPGVDLQDRRVFADFAADAVHGRDINMASDGSARRAFCYIADAMTGFFHVLLKGEPGRPYNVANRAGDLSIRELAELIVSLFPEKGMKLNMQSAPVTGYMPSPHARVLPVTDAIEALGWSPRVSPAAGFRRMVESYA